MIVFTCTSCGQKISVKEELAGKKGKCTHCKQLMTVPAATASTSAPTSGKEPVPSLVAGSPKDSVAALVRALRDLWLLEQAQKDELARDLQPRFTDPKLLAKELIQRGWLTPYQVNQLFQGRGQELVLGQYVLLERLGEGGMGTVFKARHRRLKRIDAIKVIRKDHLADATSIQRFHKEAEAAARLSHSNIVAVHDASEAGNTHFLAMEYVEGIDLAKMVKQCGPLPVPQACEYIRQAAVGLQHAHERGMVHRDIKPSNLFVNVKEGMVKVLDMGLARLHKDAQDSDTGALTQSGAVMGTPDYVAPEQAMNSRQVDIRGDLYSLGCTLYFLLAGQPPFPGGDLMQKLLKHQLETPVPVEQLRPEVPRGLAALMRRLMAKKPEERYQTPGELAKDLESFCRGDNSVYQAVPIGAKSVASSRPDEATLATDQKARAPLAIPLSEKTAVLLGILKKGEYLRRLAPLYPLVSTKQRRMIVGGVSALFLLLIILIAWPGGKSDSKKLAAKVDAAAKTKKFIEEDSPWKADELVGMLGSHRWQHWAPVTRVVFSPDGSRVASGGHDKLIQIWESTTGQLLATLKGHKGIIHSLSFAPDGKTLVSGSQDGTAKLWDIGAARELASIQLPGPVHYTALSPDGSTVAIAFSGPEPEHLSLKFWKVPSGKEGPSFNVGGIQYLAFAPDGKTLALVQAAAVNPFMVAEGKMASIIGGHREPLTSVAYSSDGKTMAAGSSDGLVFIWDVATKRNLATLRGHAGPVHAVAFAPDGKTLISGGEDGTVKIWEVETGVLTATLRGHLGPVHDVSFAPDSRTIVSGSADNTVRLWDLVTRGEKFPKVHQGAVTCVVYAPDGKMLASGGADQFVKFWDPAREMDLPAGAKQNARITAVAFSPDGGTLASGSQDGSLKLWDPDRAKVRETLAGHSAPISALVFSPDGKTLFSASHDATVKWWDAASGKEKKSFKHDAGVYSLALAPDGNTLATASFRGGREPSAQMRIWDAATGKERPFDSPIGVSPPRALAFLPNGKKLAGSCDTRVIIWDPDTRQALIILQQGAQVSSLAFTPDGKTLASAGLDGRIILWDHASNQKHQEWQQPGPVHGLAISPDGKYLVSANADGTLFIFRLVLQR